MGTDKKGTNIMTFEISETEILSMEMYLYKK
jgi:hypothetical protein